MEMADAAQLRKISVDIVKIATRISRDHEMRRQYFQNLMMAEYRSVAGHVPERVVREGKVPAAYFLEEVDAKGMQRGDITWPPIMPT